MLGQRERSLSLSSGDRRLSSAEVQHERQVMVSTVLTRLAEQGVGSTALQKEWEAIENPPSDEVSFCLAAARLGLDPYSDAEQYGDRIIEASRVLSPDLLTDFLDAVDPDSIESALAWISSVQSRILEPPPALVEDGEGIAGLLQSPPELASDEELEQIAEHFGVSSMVIGHQVRNQLVARH